MAKQGMARPDWTQVRPKNDVPPVPEIQGKAKHGKAHVKPIISGTSGPELKVYHELKGTGSTVKARSVADNDLARDNMLNDLPAADLQDL